MADNLELSKDDHAKEYRSRPEPRADEAYGRSLVVKRSIVIGRHKTSVSLEEPFWNALREIARERNVTLANLVGGIDSEREHNNLSSAIRVFVFDQVCRH